MIDEQIIFNAHLESGPGREQELENALYGLVEPSREEKGCIAYELHRDPEHPGRFMFYEVFADRAAHENHLNSPHFQKFKVLQEKEPGLIRSVTVTTWRKVP
jgi:quinol monooxygenase YgiN